MLCSRHIAISLITTLMVVLFGALQAGAQVSNVRMKRIAVSQDSILIDSLSIMPNELIMIANGDTLNASDYSLNGDATKIYFIQIPDVDSITAVYRVLPFHLGEEIKHKSTSLITT